MTSFKQKILRFEQSNNTISKRSWEVCKQSREFLHFYNKQGFLLRLVFYYVLPIISLTQVQCEYLESDRLICIIELFSKGSRLVSAHKLSCCVYDKHQKTVEYMHDNIPFMFDSLADVVALLQSVERQGPAFESRLGLSGDNKPRKPVLTQTSTCLTFVHKFFIYNYSTFSSYLSLKLTLF